MIMLPARTYSVSIKREWRGLYEEIWRPETFPQWAAGLSESALRQEGERWIANGAEGQIAIVFTPHNAFGVMDHVVSMEGVPNIHVPLRIVQNGKGAEVMLTLFRQPDMTEERFSADAKLIMRDLRALKAMAERQA